MSKKKVKEKLILSVTFNEHTGNYNVTGGKGGSVNELAFGVMVLTKTLVRDGHIKDSGQFMNMVKTYLEDVLYAEVTHEEN